VQLERSVITALAGALVPEKQSPSPFHVIACVLGGIKIGLRRSERAPSVAAEWLSDCIEKSVDAGLPAPQCDHAVA
jgi:hypothetical protein